MPNLNTKADAKNLQESATKYVATSFRFTPTQLRMIDRLKPVLAGRYGKDHARVDVLRTLLAEAWRAEFGDEPLPTLAGDGSAPVPAGKAAKGKGKPKGKRK